jgi:cell division protein FtsB
MYTQKKPIENAHIVRERDRRRFRELLAVLSLGIPIGLFLLLFTWQNLEVIRLGRKATELQQQRKHIEDENKALQLQLDRLTSLDAVEQKATALGFAPSDPRAIVQVQPTTNVAPASTNGTPASTNGTPASAGGAPASTNGAPASAGGAPALAGTERPAKAGAPLTR